MVISKNMEILLLKITKILVKIISYHTHVVDFWNGYIFRNVNSLYKWLKIHSILQMGVLKILKPTKMEKVENYNLDITKSDIVADKNQLH